MDVRRDRTRIRNREAGSDNLTCLNGEEMDKRIERYNVGWLMNDD